MANLFLDLEANAQLSTLANIAAVTTTTNGSAVGTVDIGTNYCSALLAVGAVTGTTPTLDVKIQESNDGSTGWTDCLGGDQNAAAFTRVTAANAAQVISFKAQKAFVRAVLTVGGTTPSFTCGVYLLAQKKDWGGPGWTNSGTAGTTV